MNGSLMNRSALFFAAATAIVLTAACAKEAIQEEVIPSQDGMKQIEFSVVLEDNDTKAWLDGLSVCWNEGDKVAVFDGIKTKPNEFTVSNISGRSATISGTVSDEATEFLAVYPFSAAKSRTATGVTINLSQYQLVPDGRKYHAFQDRSFIGSF